MKRLLLRATSSIIILTLLLQCIQCASANNQHHGAVDVDNNEFAEFEDVDTIVSTTGEKTSSPPINDDEEEAPAPAKAATGRASRPSDDDDDAVLEDDEGGDEFSHLQDEDEFENYDKDRADIQDKATPPSKSDQLQPQPLKFADVPAHFRSNWMSYQVELLVLAGLAVYLVNYLYGRTRNQSLAYAWFNEHRALLEQQFAVVGWLYFRVTKYQLLGDDGTSTTVTGGGHLIRETDCSYSIWCTGRIGCQGMHVQLKLLKRQDLVGVISQLIRPKYDRVIVRVELDNNEMDSFVMAIGQRKSVVKLVKEMADLSMFTAEKKGSEKLGLPDSFAVFSEIAEATASMIDSAIVSTLKKYEQYIEYIHFSDQYSGVKPSEGETVSRQPDTSRVLIFSFNIPGRLSASERHIESTKSLMTLVFHCIEKIRHYRLSREGKAKADKKRQVAQEAFLKTTHQQRQEAAQARREEKTRERKQRLMEEEDPDKQRRLEKQEQKRDAKLKQPKMKQLKLKQ